MIWAAVHRQVEEKSFGLDKSLWIIKHPQIIGRATFTIGPPNRACYFYRLGNGVTIFIDPITREPFGWDYIEGLNKQSIVILPIQGTLYFVPPLD